MHSFLLNRKTRQLPGEEGNFSIERLAGFDIAGKTTGIIGTGRMRLLLPNNAGFDSG
jgi:lactate dehydrogenase-like 2-hydroxyacid dehydrogenase